MRWMAEAERWVADTVRWVAESCLNIVDDRMKDRQRALEKYVIDFSSVSVCTNVGIWGGGGEDLAN